jgi:hypothetical protein
MDPEQAADRVIYEKYPSGVCQEMIYRFACSPAGMKKTSGGLYQNTAASAARAKVSCQRGLK